MSASPILAAVKLKPKGPLAGMPSVAFQDILGLRYADDDWSWTKR
jgi:hypothetical protein